MNDREFIELLNLYVDREICPEDAVRLEAEVGTHPERRRVYDQYCRMQKACSMLSAQLPEAALGGPERPVVAFPEPGAWRIGPVFVGLATAACIIAFFGLRERSVSNAGRSPSAAVDSGRSRSVPDTMDLSLAPDPMRSVFFAPIPGSQAALAAPKPVLVMAEQAPQLDQLGWIGDIHMAPVFSAANPDFLLTPKALQKAAASDEPQNGRAPQEPGEMTAFRFQR